jgi:hypothetical protein
LWVNKVRSVSNVSDFILLFVQVSSFTVVLIRSSFIVKAFEQHKLVLLVVRLDACFFELSVTVGF